MTDIKQLSGRIYRDVKIAAFALVIMTACGSETSAQQNARKIDSLEILLPGDNDSVRISLLTQLCLEYIDVNNSRAIAYGNQGLKVAYQAKDTIQVAELSSIIATALRRLYKMDSAILLGKQALYFATKKNKPELIIRAHNGLGVAHLFQGKYDSALIHNFQNLDLIKKLPGSSYAKHTLGNIGLIYYKLSDYKRAIHFLSQSLKLYGKEDGQMVSGVNLNIALCYLELKEFRKSKTYIDSALALCRKGDCPNYYRSTIYNALGLFFYDQEKYDSASSNFIKSNRLGEPTNTRILLENATILARIETKQNNYGTALKYLKKVEPLLAADVSMLKEEVRFYSALADVYDKMGDKKSAAGYQQKYLEAKDSIYTVGLRNNIMNATVGYYQKDNEALIKSQDHILKLREKIISGQRLLNVVIIGVVISLLILGATLILLNRKKQSRNRLLDHMVQERTKALEQSHLETIKILQERELQLKKDGQRVKSLLATISGICELGSKEAQHKPVLTCFTEINRASKAMLNKLDHNL